MKIKDQIRLLKMLHPKEDWLKAVIERLKTLQAQEEALSKGEILELAKRIKPVMRGNKNYVAIYPEQIAPLYWLDHCSVATNSFSNTAKPIREAVGLQEIARIVTYHRYGNYYGFLNPSLEECIQQCPPEIIDKVCAVEILGNPSDIINIYDCRMDRHILTTIYYTGELPEDIAAQKVKW